MKSARFDPANLQVFLAIARHGNFRRAAIELGVSASALSHALRMLEQRVGVRLINRTTRSLALTEAGERLRTKVEPALQDIREALETLDDFRGRPSGTLRINATLQAAKLVLMPVLAEFLTAYSEIRVELLADDSTTADLVSGGFDAGVRIGERVAASMIATPLGPRQRMAIVGSPAWFERHPRPRNPRSLQTLPCIRYRLHDGSIYDWEFERRGVELKIAVDGPLTLGSQDLMIEAARAGVGLACVFESAVRGAIADGSLVQVLRDWCAPFPGFFLYYPHRRQHSAAFRALLDFLRPGS